MTIVQTKTPHGIYATWGQQGDEPMVAIIAENDGDDTPIITFLCPQHARELAGDISAMSIEVDGAMAALRPEVTEAAERVTEARAGKTNMTVDELMALALSLDITAEALLRYSEQ